MSDEYRIRESGGLTSILAEYLTRIDRNESISRESLLAQHPEHAAELQNYFDDVDLFERLTKDSANARSDSGPTTPRRFGDYELLREIGRGGMGIIYQAQECSTGRLVALKMLLHGLFLSPAEAARFRNEARTAAALRHPNIVPIYHVGEHDGHLFYTMPLIHGINLAQRLAAGPLEPRDAVRLLLAVAEAVDFAHASGVIHRDLKPANVLLDESGNPHVADFGLARRLGDESLSITATGDLLGTPNYMAPEQVNSSQDLIGSTTDVYAMGAILYALLVGQPPFQSESVSETLQKICTADPLSPRKLNKRVPLDLETICLKCLEKSPTNRYGSAQELADDLRHFLGGTPLRARPVSRIERGRRWFVRNPVVGTLAVATALALVAGTAFSTYYALQSREREREALANLYAADMNLAQQYLRSGAVGSAINLLERHRPPSGNVRDAAWEWRHLWHQCHGELRRFEGPHGAVYSVAFSPDGRTVAAAGADKTVWLWETATGKVKLKFQGHTATIRDVAFAPDGQRIVTVADDMVGIIWDTTTGKRLAKLQGHEQPLTTVAFSADGRFIATGGANEANVNIWDGANGGHLQSLDLGPAASLAFRPSGLLLAVAGRDGFVRVCDLDQCGSCTTVKSIQAHTVLLHDLAWTPDGTRLATAGADHIVKLWDTDSWREVAGVPSLNEQIYSVNFSPDGRQLAVAVRNAPIKVWDLEQPQSSDVLLGHAALVTCVDYSPDGWRLVSASEDGTVRLWNAAQSTDHDRLDGHFGFVTAVDFSSRGNTLASATRDDSTIILWNPVTCQPIRALTIPEAHVFDLAFSPDGLLLTAAQSGPYVHIWNVESANLKSVLTLNSNQDFSRSVVWIPDGSQAAYQTSDDAIRRVEPSRGGQLEPWSSPMGQTASIAFNHDGSLLAKCSDRLVLVRQTSTQALLHKLRGHNAPVVKVVFNPDGTRIASSSNDHTIRLWEAATGRHLWTLSGHGGTPFGLSFSPDGTRLASSSTEQTVKIWDVATGLELQSLVGHKFWARDVAFSADGQHLASAGYDGSVRVWHAPTEVTEWTTTREAAALVRHLSARLGSPEATVAAIKADQTISEPVRTAAIRQTESLLYYWTPMLNGHRAAERGEWAEAIRAFERATTLAPNEPVLWHWLAMASIAANRHETYDRVCDELVRRVGPTASEGDLYWIIRTWLAMPHESIELASIQAVVDVYAQQYPELRKYPWLYTLRNGSMRHQEVLDPAISLAAEDWYIVTTARLKAGEKASALTAFQQGTNAARKHPKDVRLWYVDVFRETLRKEAEGLLAEVSPSEGATRSGAIIDVASLSYSVSGSESRHPTSSDVSE